MGRTGEGATGLTEWTMELPAQAAAILARLRGAGYGAYAVGGCVRDALLGRTPGDWDICTAAPPAAVRALFAGRRLVLTGEKHGTVGVIAGDAVYEITTYRLDGAYADHRHPDAVAFVGELRQDLARRDFTVNAMAYAPGEGLIDLFGGRADLAARRLRCVGVPRQRFAEDALRILRALRFAAQLDFTLDPPTAAAALAARDSLRAVSAERLFAELDKLLGGAAAGAVLGRCGEILAGALPEILPCIGCAQPPRWHCYDVWQHTAAAVGALPALFPPGYPAGDRRCVLWAVLLHDLAKPACRDTDAAGVVHFHGHNQAGARMAADILTRLRAPRALREDAVALVSQHDGALPTGEADILRLLASTGPEQLHRLCLVKYADLDAHAPSPEVAVRRARVSRFEARMTQLAAARCYRLQDLAVNGADALAAGLAPGPAVGLALNGLLNAVLAGRLPNARPALLAALRSVADREAARRAGEAPGDQNAGEPPRGEEENRWNR